MNIKFRPINEDDLSFLNETRNLVANEYLHDSRTFTLGETYLWFTKTKPDYHIILNGQKPIGYFRLSNYSKINKNIYIGADIHPDFWGNGYAYEAYKLFIPYLFDEYKLHKISLEVLSTNERAIHLYKKLGFIEEGKKRQEVLKNNIFIDSIIMSILKTEYNLIKKHL